MKLYLNLPQYVSQEKVRAAKILRVTHTIDGAFLVLETDIGPATVEVGLDYVGQHGPQPDGYFVVYEDGYLSWAPARAFDSEYRRVPDYAYPVDTEVSPE